MDLVPLCILKRERERAVLTLKEEFVGFPSSDKTSIDPKTMEGKYVGSATLMIYWAAATACVAQQLRSNWAATLL